MPALRIRRIPVVCAVLGLVALLIAPSITNALTLSDAWQAKLGTGGINGTATIRLYLGGTGSIALSLARLRTSTSLPVTLSAGTCGSVGKTLVRFPAIRTTSVGGATRTSSLSAGQISLIRYATTGSGRIAIRVGSSTTGGTRCGTFATLSVPAYVAARIPIGGGEEGPTIDANGAGVFVLSGSDGTVSRIDQVSNSLVSWPLEVSPGESPDSIAYGEGALWVTMFKPNFPGSVERLDPTTGKVLARIVAGSGCSVTTSPGAVWAVDERAGTIVRIDPTTNTVAATIPTGPDVCTIGVAFGSVWTGSAEGRHIWRIDPVTNKVVATIPADLADLAYNELVYGLGSVWTADVDGNVIRVDPATNTVAATIVTAEGLQALAAGGGSIWVSHQGTNAQADGVVTRIDPATNRVVATIRVGTKPGPIAYAGGFVWVALRGEPIVVQVNAATNKIQSRIPVGGIPEALVVTDRAVWVAVSGGTSGSTTPTEETLVRINF